MDLIILWATETFRQTVLLLMKSLATGLAKHLVIARTSKPLGFGPSRIGGLMTRAQFGLQVIAQSKPFDVEITLIKVGIDAKMTSLLTVLPGLGMKVEVNR